MPLRRLPSSTLFFAVVASMLASPAAAQTGTSSSPITENPIPAPVEKRGLAVEIRDYVQLPRTLGLLPAERDVNPAGLARVSFVVDAPDGRRFANDQRGFIYIIDENSEPKLWLDFRPEFPYTLYNRLESGLIGFAFHPEFT